MKNLKDINKIAAAAGIHLTTVQWQGRTHQIEIPVKASRRLKKLYKALNKKGKALFNKKLSEDPKAIYDLLEG